MKTSTKIKSVHDILGLLGEQLDAMRPHNKPTGDHIKAAGKTTGLVNSHMHMVKLVLKAGESMGVRPDLSSLGFAKPTVKPAQLRQ